MALQVRFDEIPAEGLRVEVRDQSWFPGDEIAFDGQVEASVYLVRKGRTRVLLEGRLSVVFLLACDRCLEEARFPVDTEFTLDLELVEREDEAALGAEHTCSHAEMDAVFLYEPLVDIGEILKQQVFLAMPARVLCAEDCRGLCPRCGSNLNEAACGCEKKSGASPFDVLKKLAID